MRMIERVARAIAGSAYDHPDTEPDQRRAYRDQAKAAIAAMREPTDDVVTAGRKECIVTREQAKRVYRVMIDAALKENVDG